MKTKLEIPIIVKRVKITGPIFIRRVNLLLDTGALFTTLNRL